VLLLGRPTQFPVSKSSAVLTHLLAVAKQCSIRVNSALPRETEQQAALHACSSFCGFDLRELGEKKQEPKGKFTIYHTTRAQRRSRGIALLFL